LLSKAYLHLRFVYTAKIIIAMSNFFMVI